jgi:anti-sigma regulatory factor (Ser/Thr protein kinase)
MDANGVDAVRLAVSEAVTNAIVHGYRGERGKVDVVATAVNGDFWVLVSDAGCGCQTPAVHPGLGWGLALITDACNEFSLVDRAEGGTEARMRFEI